MVRSIPLALASLAVDRDVDALEGVRGRVGTQGVFALSAIDHRGTVERARVPVVIRDGRFRRLPEQGRP